MVWQILNTSYSYFFQLDWLDFRLIGCPKDSLDNLDLLDLMKKSRINKECMNEARKVFKTNYQKMTFVVQGPMVDEEEAVFYEFNPKNIYIQNINVFEQLSKHFGDFIRKIEVLFDAISIKDVRKIMKHINDHCFNTLEILYLDGCEGEMLTYLTKPFPNVYKLLFASSLISRPFVQLNSSTKRFSDLFREVHILYLQVWIRDWEAIDGSYPKVRKIDIRIDAQDSGAHTPHIIRFLNKNVQITDLTLGYSNVRILHAVNEALHQLEALTLVGKSQYYDNFDCNPIEFKTVHRFSFQSTDYNEMPHKISLVSVQKITLLNVPEFDEKWLKSLALSFHDRLHTIDISTNKLKNEALLAIPSMAIGLQSISVASKSHMPADIVIELINKGKRLLFMEFNVFMTGKEQEYLNQTLSGDWNVKYKHNFDHSVHISIDRKKYGKKYWFFSSQEQQPALMKSVHYSSDTSNHESVAVNFWDFRKYHRISQTFVK